MSSVLGILVPTQELLDWIVKKVAPPQASLLVFDSIHSPLIFGHCESIREPGRARMNLG